MQHNKNYAIVGAIILVAIIAIVIGIKPQSTVSGFDTLSLTSGTGYSSTDPFFNSPVYTVAVVASGSSGSLKGTFIPSQIQDFTNSFMPSNTFDVYIDILNQSCSNTILGQSATPVYSYSWQTARARYSESCSCYADVQSGCQAVCGSGTCGYIPKACANIVQTKIGDVYQLDTVTHYDNLIRVTLAVAGQNYSIYLTPSNTTSQILNTVRATFVGSLLGTQSCPIPSSDTVLFRPINTNILIPKSNAYYPSIVAYSTTTLNPYNGDVPEARSTVINNFVASSPYSAGYCVNQVAYGSSAAYSCAPQSPVTLPVIKLYIKADVLGVVVPSGTPKIVSIGTPSIEAAQTTNIPVTIQNIGSQTDSFDISIQGTPSINIQPTRISLGSQQTQTINVLIQGAGIIGNYVVYAKSVNDPTKVANYTVSFKIEPFCDRTPETGKVKVSTEFGCYWVCQNQYSTDIREKTCQPFGTFEPRGAYNSLTQTGLDASGKPIYSNINLQGEFHCTGIGTYKSLEDYMDKIYNPDIDNITKELIGNYDYSKIYKPEEKTGLVWLPAPICNYVGEYGYHYANGQANIIGSELYQYGSTPSNGIQQTSTTQTCSAGYQYVLSTNSCQLINTGSTVCETGSVYNPNTNRCELYQNSTIVCSDPNAIVVNGECISYISQTIQDVTYVCPANSILITTTTPPTCQITALQDCPSGYQIINGKCIGNAQTNCPIGYNSVNGGCAKDNSSWIYLGVAAIIFGLIAIYLTNKRRFK